MSTAPQTPTTLSTSSEPPTPTNAQIFRRHLEQISFQSSVFFTGTIFTAASGYLFKIYLARVLKAEAFGIYVLGMTIIGFLGIFNGLGLPHSAVRFVSTYTGAGDYGRLLVFLGWATALLLLANCVFAGIFLLLGQGIALKVYHAPALVPYLHFFIWIMFFGALTTFFGQVLAGYKDVTRRTLITNFIGVPCTVLFTVALILKGWGLSGYLLAQIASAILVLVLLLRSIFVLTPWQARTESVSLWKFDPEIVVFSSAVFGMGILEFVLAQGDKILLGIYLSAREVGVYAVAMAVVSFVPVALQSVNQIFSPIIADLHARGEYELLQRLFQTLTKWVLGLTLPLATGIMIFAAPIMRVFGADFESGWPILVIGTVGQLVNCGVGSVGYLLLMSGQQRRLLKVQGKMAILVVLLNLAFIPRYGIYGAVLATAIVNVATNIWNLREVRNALGFSPYNAGYFHLLPPFLAATITMLTLKVFIAFIQPEWILILLALALGYSVFLTVACVLGPGGENRVIAAALWTRARSSILGEVAVKS